MKVTTATWNRESNTFALSGSVVRHDAVSAMNLLTRRGYDINAAAILLMFAKRSA